MSVKQINGYVIEDIFCHTRITKDNEFVAGYDKIIKHGKVGNEKTKHILDWYSKVNNLIGTKVFKGV